MNTLILSLHVVVCITLVILVLLQSGKEGMGVIFGGGNSSVFGSSGAGGMLAKLTAFVAILFVGTCLSYNLMTSTTTKQESTILDVHLEDAAPATPDAAKQTPATPDAATQSPAKENPAPSQDAPAEKKTPAAEKKAPAEEKKAPAAQTPDATKQTPAKKETPKAK